MDAEAAEAEFLAWVDEFKAGLPTPAWSTFLSTEHLRAAWMAALRAASKVNQE